MKNFNDITFLATNTKSVEKIIKEELFETITNGMTDTERMAFILGVDNTLSLIKQHLEEDVNSDTIIFYNPDVEVTTECDGKEVFEWLHTKPTVFSC